MSYYVGDFTRSIIEYDEMLLMDEEQAKNWRFDYSAGRSTMTVDEKQQAACACVRHVLEDFLKWTPEVARQRLADSKEILKMYRLDILLCRGGIFQSYGYLTFEKLDNINSDYLLSLCYPDEIYFSYADSALKMYRDSRTSKEIVKEGGSRRNATLPTNLSKNISDKDMNSLTAAFFQEFITTIINPLLPRSDHGMAYDLYRLFGTQPAYVSRLVTENFFENVFAYQYENDYYSLLMDHILEVCSYDDIFARNMFAFALVSKGIPGADKRIKRKDTSDEEKKAKKIKKKQETPGTDQ